MTVSFKMLAARSRLRHDGWLTYEQKNLILNRMREIGWDDDDAAYCSESYRLDLLDEIEQVWVPGVPVSVNAKAGRRAQWIAALDDVLLPSRHPRFVGRRPRVNDAVQVFMDFMMPVPSDSRYFLIGMPHTRRPDIDNLAKPVMDRMQHCGYFRDDCRVSRVVPDKTWCARTDGGVTITIASWWLTRSEIFDHLYRTSRAGLEAAR